LKIQFHGCELKQQQRIKQKAYGIALFSAWIEQPQKSQIHFTALTICIWVKFSIIDFCLDQQREIVCLIIILKIFAVIGSHWVDVKGRNFAHGRAEIKKYLRHISTPTWQSPILELPQHPVTRTHKWKQFPPNVSWAKNMIENIDFHAHTSSVSEEIASCEHHTPTSDEMKFMAANWNRDNVCDIMLGMRRMKENEKWYRCY
jgi:hypothetical protein